MKLVKVMLCRPLDEREFVAINPAAIASCEQTYHPYGQNSRRATVVRLVNNYTYVIDMGLDDFLAQTAEPVQ